MTAPKSRRDTAKAGRTAVTAKETIAKRAATRKATAKSTAKKAPAKKSTTARKAPAKSTAKTAPAKKAPAKKAPAKKATAKKATAKKAPAKRTPARRTAPATTSTARKTVSKTISKYTAKRAPAKKDTAKRTPAKKEPAKKTTARNASKTTNSFAIRRTTSAERPEGRRATNAAARPTGETGRRATARTAGAPPRKVPPANVTRAAAATRAVGRTRRSAADTVMDAKTLTLRAHEMVRAGTTLTTDQGILVEDTDNTLRAGPRGPSLLEDFHAREKITRFDHERIPERVVHARGSGAHGYFQPYGNDLARYTMARFLADPSVRTPVFVRFSTVQGSRGSTDTPRDVRGFATKFYTDQGNFDLVGNNMPVFFIQDGVKFPDVIHAVKPEPHHEMPQAASAHDTFWDFVSLQPETLHHVMWLMSDRAIPRSFRMMQGFGVHTFRLVDEDGMATFVKFHWTPAAGVHSLVWDEAQKISGKDPDFNRRDLWESIEMGEFPEYELGVQLIPESMEFEFDDIDLLDVTKIVPEEIVPVTPVGRMVLNRNPENFFAETEQVAFCVSNIVPGIDFTDDPMLQMRAFSYLDTQLTRLGGPNFAQLPINQPLAAVHNHQQDGFHQHAIPVGQANYHPNSLGEGCPVVPGAAGMAFVHTREHVDGTKARRRPETFAEHCSQPRLFWNSMSAWEKEHIVNAFRFELGKVTHQHIRERMVEHLNHIDHTLALSVAAGIGVAPPKDAPLAHVRVSPALSQASMPGKVGVLGRKVALLVADGVAGDGVTTTRDALTAAGARVDLLAPLAGSVRVDGGGTLPVDHALATTGSVLYDAVVVAGGETAVDALLADGYAVHFVAEAYKHGKALGVLGVGDRLVQAARLPVFADSDRPGAPASKPMAGALDGVVFLAAGSKANNNFTDDLVVAIAAHRHYDRPVDGIPA